MHEIQRNGAVLPTGQCDTDSGIITGFPLFFYIFFYTPFNIFSKMILAEMRSAVSNERDSWFLAFQALDRHEKPLETNDWLYAEYLPVFVVCCEKENEKHKNLKFYIVPTYIKCEKIHSNL
jgi:type III secretory pathway component EscV